MIRMTLADYAKIHGQAKAASDFGVAAILAAKEQGIGAILAFAMQVLPAFWEHQRLGALALVLVSDCLARCFKG